MGRSLLLAALGFGVASWALAQEFATARVRAEEVLIEDPFHLDWVVLSPHTIDGIKVHRPRFGDLGRIRERRGALGLTDLTYALELPAPHRGDHCTLFAADGPHPLELLILRGIVRFDGSEPGGPVRSDFGEVVARRPPAVAAGTGGFVLCTAEATSLLPLAESDLPASLEWPEWDTLPAGAPPRPILHRYGFRLAADGPVYLFLEGGTAAADKGDCRHRYRLLRLDSPPREVSGAELACGR
jgi:hypothetical protein